MRILLALTLLLVTLPSHAAFAPKAELTPFRIGIMGGPTQLFGDPGAQGEGSFGLGASFSYTLNTDFEIEARYLRSDTGNVAHGEFSVSALYTLPLDVPEDWRTYAIGGVSFLSNDFDVPNVKGDAVAISLGAGAEYYFTSQFCAGPEIRYQKGFGSESNVGLTQNKISLVEDSATFLVRVVYSIGILE